MRDVCGVKPYVMYINLSPLFKYVILSSICIIISLCYCSLMAQPVISSFNPQSGPIGTTVIINGASFSTTPANNIVYFGAVKATVTNSTASSITVKVPAGASYRPVSVTVNYLTGYSAKPFAVSFSGSGPLTRGSFGYSGPIDSFGQAADIHAVDFDGDGKPDIATVNVQNNTLSIYRNISTGTVIKFATKIDYATGQLPYKFTVGDIDGDGKQDIAVANQKDSSIYIYKNNSAPGTIAFANASKLAAIPYVDGVTVTDIDLDGKPDVAFTGNRGFYGTFGVLRNIGSNGAILFAPKTEFTTTGEIISDLLVNDFDGDGKPDAATIDLVGGISVIRNTSTAGNVSFGTQNNILAAKTPVYFAAGDINGDGKPEIIYADLTNQVKVLINTSVTGNISLVQGTNITSGSGYYSYAKGIEINDIDGDGKPDMTVVNNGSVSFFKNNSTTAGISFTDKIDFNFYGDGDLTSGDFDTDGKPDFALLAGAFKAQILRNAINEPFIASFTPPAAAKGEIVKLLGNNFTGATAVSFGGVPAATFTVDSATGITATLADGLSGSIEVTTKYGKGKIDGFIFAGPPAITSFTPDTAISGTRVTITGKNLYGVYSISFGGIAATYSSILSSSTIQANVDYAASGNVTVTNKYGTASKPGFVYIPVPRIQSFTPQGGAENTPLTIKGSGFTKASKVSIGNFSVNSFTVVSDSVITAVTGKRAVGSITVTTRGGTGTSQAFFYCTPIITSFSPASAKAGDFITVRGYNFLAASQVIAGGATTSFTVQSDSVITFNIYNASPGNISITGPGGTATMGGFVYNSPPVITSFTPNIGVKGTPVIITGLHFTGTTSVKFIDTKAASFTVLADTLIKAIVDTAYSTAGPLTVTTPYGTATATIFFYANTPRVSNIAPVSGKAGDLITITGTNFSQVAANNAVYFGPVKATVTSAGLTNIVVKVPAGAAYSRISVTNTINKLTALSSQYFTPVVVGVRLTNSSFSGKTVLKTLASPAEVSVADFDGDGKADLAVADTAGNAFSCFRNTSTTSGVSFAARVDYTVAHPRQVLVTDVDGDGKPDIYVRSEDTTYSPGTYAAIIYVYINESTPGHFSFTKKSEMHTGPGFYSITTADINFDGKPDIAFTDNRLNQSLYYLNNSANGNISFSQNGYIALTNSSFGKQLPSQLLFDDVDGDGFSDLTTFSDYSLNSYDPVISIYKSGSLDATTRNPAYVTYKYNFNQAPGGGLYSDIDLDGKLDLLQAAPYGGFTIMHHTNTHSTKQPYYFGFDAPFYSLARVGLPADANKSASLTTCDMTGDGKPEIISTNWYDDSAVTIYINGSTPGKISINDWYTFSLFGSSRFLTASDIDGDGTPDIISTHTGSNEIFILKHGAPVPLSLTNFTGALVHNTTQLNWQTVSESNTSNFIVERSLNAIDFSPIGNVKAAGNSSATQNYAYTDNGVNRFMYKYANIYYRLKMADVDGKFTYSKMVTIHIGETGSLLQVYPNPASNFITVNLPNSSNKAQLQLTGINGRLIKTITLANRQQQAKIYVGNFAKGAYIVSWSDGYNKQTATVLVE